MQFSFSVILILQYISWIGIRRQVCAIPLNQTDLVLDDYDDPSLAEDYANMKYDLIHNLGYSLEFADMVEINLKRAVREEKERQKQEGISSSQKPDLQRQNQISEEYEDDESTLPPGPTTPGPSPGDIVRGVAGIITSVGTFNLGNFWGSFVNFFPPIHREGAQAVVESTLGRRPSKWPTLPTTTTKLTTTTQDPDDIDSAETTKSAVTAVPAGSTATTVSPGTATGAPAAGAAVTQAGLANVAPATEPGTRAPTTKYTLRRRTGTVLPDVDFETTTTGIEGGSTNNGALKVSGNALVEDDEIELSSSTTNSPTAS